MYTQLVKGNKGQLFEKGSNTYLKIILLYIYVVYIYSRTGYFS